MSDVLVETDPSPMKLEILNVDDWPVAKESVGSVSRTVDQTEMNYILEGEGMIDVLSEDGDIVSQVAFTAGDMVTVMPDTTCTWNITEAIERHYAKG